MVKGSKHTEESRAKMSTGKKGQSPHKGRVHTPEARANMRAAATAQRRNDSGYRAAHRRAERSRGRASEYVCECGQPAQHWAFLWRETPRERWMIQARHTYSLDEYDYAPMCVRCATWYDMDQELRKFVEEGTT